MTTQNKPNNQHLINQIIEEGSIIEALDIKDFDLKSFLIDLDDKLSQITFVSSLVSSVNNRNIKHNNNNDKYQYNIAYINNNMDIMHSLLLSITSEIRAIRNTFLQSNIVKPYLQLKDEDKK